jgi:hypothetical protein
MPFRALASLLGMLLIASTLAAQEEADPHAGHLEHQHSADAHEMPLLGDYAAARESSGTSWQPDSTPHEAFHLTRGSWMLMVHGYAELVWDDQGGQRGDDEAFLSNMLMLGARRPLGGGIVGLRAMVDIEPETVGVEGYPLLLQAGESADGHQTLIDRQHPHDAFMELSASWSRTLAPGRSLFVYGGLPGEPALGPPVFMHRFSAHDIPEAPIAHHWLDSTHISFGVVTVGWVEGPFKAEASAFRGREPDEHRWDIESPELDSWSGRLSWNPAADWALQLSHGSLESPEALEPEIDVDRTTASASWNHSLGETWRSQTTLAWGRNHKQPGPTLDAWLLESAWHHEERDVFFGRFEATDKDELFDHDSPLHGEIFEVIKLSLGYRRDWDLAQHFRGGLGALGSVYALPSALEPHYGSSPLSFMIFGRVELVR